MRLSRHHLRWLPSPDQREGHIHSTAGITLTGHPNPQGSKVVACSCGAPSSAARTPHTAPSGPQIWPRCGPGSVPCPFRRLHPAAGLQRCTGLLLKLEAEPQRSETSSGSRIGGGFCVWQVALERRLNRQRTYVPNQGDTGLGTDMSLDGLPWIRPLRTRCLDAQKPAPRPLRPDHHGLESPAATSTRSPPSWSSSRNAASKQNVTNKIGRIRNGTRLVSRLAAHRCPLRAACAAFCPRRPKKVEEFTAAVVWSLSIRLHRVPRFQ